MNRSIQFQLLCVAVIIIITIIVAAPNFISPIGIINIIMMMITNIIIIMMMITANISIDIVIVLPLPHLQEMFRSKEYCADIWDYLHRNRAALTNPLYMDPNHEDTPTTHSLIPPLSQLLRNVTLWTDYFYRYCSLPTIVTPPTQLSDYLYESGV